MELVRLALKLGLCWGLANGHQPEECFRRLKGYGTNNGGEWLFKNSQSSKVDHAIDEVMGFTFAVKNAPSDHIRSWPQPTMKGIGDGPAIAGFWVG